MAAAVPSLPAKAWGDGAGLGLAGLGALGAWNINELAPASTFQMGDPMAIFGALLVFAAAVERVLEPFTRWMPGRTEQERYEKAVADLDNGVPGAMNAVAHYKAAVDSARATRGILMWGIATCAATVLAASSGFYLLRLLSADPRLERGRRLGRRARDRPRRRQRHQAPARPHQPDAARRERHPDPDLKPSAPST